MPYRALFLLGLLSLCSCIIAARGVAAELPPEEVLAQQGLRRLSQSTTWVTPLEYEVRSRLADLPQHRDAIAALEQALSERIDFNARQWLAAKQTENSINVTLASLANNDPARAELIKRRNQVLAQAISPDRLNQQADVREQLVELSKRRYALWTTLLTVRRDVPQVAESYRELAPQVAVQTALRKLGGNHRLGPARNYGDDLRKLGEIERAALTDWVPMFGQGDRQRVTVLLNETTPVTVTWYASAEPLVLTASMAQAAGIEIPSDAPRREITLMKGRPYQVAEVSIAEFRVGKRLLKDVTALVLPPAGEDLGARLGNEAIVGLRASPQPERLRLLLSGQP